MVSNPELSIANAMDVASRSRYVSLCACNSANLTCRSHLGCRKWCDSNQTCHKCAPPVACQFCYYKVKNCPTKFQTPRRCYPLCL